MNRKMSGKQLRSLAWLTVIIVIGVGAWFSRGIWLPRLKANAGMEENAREVSPPVEEPRVLKLSPRARANLGLESKPATLQTYWRTIQIPGVVVDRPGVTDRGITSPIEGVVRQVHAFEGDIVEPGQSLFTLRLVSESLQKAQSELYKAIRETEIVRKEVARISDLVDSGVIPGKRLVELNQEIRRQAALIDASRQDLLSRGLLPAQIGQIEAGSFLDTIEVKAPDVAEPTSELASIDVEEANEPPGFSFFEVQELKVELGQQVQAGEALAVLANHNALYVKGYAFRKEASNLARAAENEWPVEVEFTEDLASDWPELTGKFHVRHLANTTDPNSRTFDFFIPLANQSRVYEKTNRTFVVWRFRPGQRVRIHIPVEELGNVFVLPAAAVVHEGPEAFVFQQNGDLFNRISVHVVHQDRTSVVIANEEDITPGMWLAQGSAASLNRVLKAQAASGMRADVHVHADGTTHAAH